VNKLRLAGLWCALLLALAGCASTTAKLGGHKAGDIKATAARAEESYANAQWASAAEAYGELVKAMPQDSNLWFRYANALARADQPDRAVSAYREVLVRDAHSSKAWFNMGIVQLRQAASSFSRMNGNISADDPLRAQGEQVYTAILEILGDDSGLKAATVVKPGPVKPAPPALATPLPAPSGEQDANGGAKH
jgi:tetratricopeptide (TPR) repeat protein